MKRIVQGRDGIPFPLMSKWESTKTGGDMHRFIEFENVFPSMTRGEIVFIDVKEGKLLDYVVKYCDNHGCQKKGGTNCYYPM
jgi:hypothetical protein